MTYLKPELEVVAEAQNLILGDKQEFSGDGENEPPGENKPAEIVGLDD